MFKVYILYSELYTKTYVGFTSDIEARLASHNVLATKGFSIRYRPWKLIYFEDFMTKREALKRERYLKSGKGRQFVQKVVEDWRATR